MKTKKWTYWAKMAAGFLISAIIAWEISRYESIFEAFASVDAFHILLGVLLLIPNIGLTLVRWNYILNSALGKIRLHESAGSMLLGYALGLITPGRLGDLGRGLYFTEHDRTFITGLNIFDKMAAQFAIALLGYIALTYMVLNGILLPEWSILILTLGGLFVLASFILVFFPRQVGRGLIRLQRTRFARFLPTKLIEALMAIRLRDSLLLVGISLVWTLFLVLQYHVVISGFAEVSLFESFLAVTATFLVKILFPLTFGELGIREGIAVYFFSLLAVPAVAAFNTSLLIFLINTLLPGLIGSYFLFKVRLRLRQTPPNSAPGREASISEKNQLERLGGVQDG